jgi:hypothetical protein
MASKAKSLASPVKSPMPPPAILRLSQTEAGWPTEKGVEMKRYYLQDLRQKSVYSGKPEGAYLKIPPSPTQWVPAQWAHRRANARSFTAEEIEELKKEWPYLEGCEIVPAECKGTTR